MIVLWNRKSRILPNKNRKVCLTEWTPICWICFPPCALEASLFTQASLFRACTFTKGVEYRAIISKWTLTASIACIFSARTPVVWLPNTFELEQDVFLLNRGYKQETRRRKLKTMVWLPNTFELEQDVFLLNRGYKQETRRRKLKTSKTDFRQAENTRLYMIEKNGK